MRSFRPLPRTFTCCDKQVDVGAIDSPQLRQPHSRRVEQLEDREVAHVGEAALLRVQLGALKQQLDLRAVEIAGQIPLELRAADAARGIRLDHLVAVHVRVEAPNRRERARDRSLARASLRVRCARNPRIARRSTPSQLHSPAAVVAAEVRDELGEIAAVRLERVRRDVRAPSRDGGESRRPRAIVGRLAPLQPVQATRDIAFDRLASTRSSPQARARRSSRAFSSCRECAPADRRRRPKFAFIGWKCAGSASRM